VKRTVLISLTSALFVLTAWNSAAVIAAPALTISSSGNGTFVLQGSAVDGVAALDITVRYDVATLTNPQVTQGGLISGAMMAVNVFGDVVDPDTGEIIAGARSKKKGKTPLADSMKVMRRLAKKGILAFARGNTVIGVVATNAKFNKEEATKVARMAMNGIARTIRPANTMLDGDTLFALATGKRKADVNIVGAYAAEVVALAVVRAVRTAKGAGGIPGIRDL